VTARNGRPPVISVVVGTFSSTLHNYCSEYGSLQPNRALKHQEDGHSWPSLGLTRGEVLFQLV